MPLPKPKHDTWPLDKIIEGQNARKVEIDEGIRELCNSIVANGLLQPLIVLDNYHLIAGFRRLAALRLAKVDSAAVSIYPSTLTPSQIKVINLTEKRPGGVDLRP
ncbi:MAG: ParB N-terminal domain-containing protein [Isosphaeraceae bacterium]